MKAKMRLAEKTLSRKSVHWLWVDHKGLQVPILIAYKFTHPTRQWQQLSVCISCLPESDFNYFKIHSLLQMKTNSFLRMSTSPSETKAENPSLQALFMDIMWQNKHGPQGQPHREHRMALRMLFLPVSQGRLRASCFKFQDAWWYQSSVV